MKSIFLNYYNYGFYASTLLCQLFYQIEIASVLKIAVTLKIFSTFERPLQTHLPCS